MSREEAIEANDSGSAQPERKRKRLVNEEDELEIDLDLPEPPSKKALRKLKKGKSVTSKPATTTDTSASAELNDEPAKESAPAKSEWAIWIGNMLWTTSKDELREFFADKGGIAKDAITRVHMPPPPPKGPTWKGPKPVNKGFAYVDFATEADMLAAIGLSETLLAGRKVLIKNAKSFEGRPDAQASETAVPLEKAPSKRIFVGNLTFETTTDDVREHFSQAGEVEDVFLTTFEDSGKCKGYGWVRFASLEAAQAAVAGFIYKAADESDDEAAADGPAKAKKPRKWFINRLQGRALRCEFAEDAQTRYKKRFNKGTKTTGESNEPGAEESSTQRPSKRLDKDERQALRRQKHEDARNVAPGRALARAQRASAAIVAPAGKKTSFN
ncbi:hypothetical protein AMS68_006719 [Peltaster fructicola]|uniref:RRM domain-containing protein n=1 Tax=Peltaster fructicola TaxID=286661 RepID=A0A6H0Y2F7_9PEZI|nr:hypothetical protein AMS68_006719 [Peltaster fructicola]